ncbi:MAG: AI-2E family transporter [Planctomycetaceae bacterium]
MPRLVSLAILTGLIVFLGITFYQIVAPFLLPLFLAAVTAVWCQPLYGLCQRKLRGRNWLAAGATVAIVCVVLFVPLVLTVVTAAIQLRDFASRHQDSITSNFEKLQHRDRPSSDQLKEKVRELAIKALDFAKPIPDATSDATVERRDKVLAERQQILDDLDKNLTAASQDAGQHLQELAMKSLGLAASGGWGLTTRTFGLLGALVGGLIGLTMFLIGLYFFLCDGAALLAATEKLIPMQVEYQRQLMSEFTRVMQAVVSATMFSAMAQGAATALTLYCVGFHNLFLLFVLATFSSLIPVAGTWLVWGPCAVWLWVDGSYGSALFLALIGIAAVSAIDNIIKARVLGRDAGLHPLLAFVSVFGGMQAMGLWGIFVGPVVACCLHALIKIFNTELIEFSKARINQNPAATATAPSPSASAPAPPQTP